MLLHISLSKSIFKKLVKYITTVYSDMPIGQKIFYCTLMSWQNAMSIILMMFTFLTISFSVRVSDVMGKAFGIIIMDEFDNYTCDLFMIFMESFHSKILNRDDFLSVQIDQNKATTVYIYNMTCYILCFSICSSQMYYQYDHTLIPQVFRLDGFLFGSLSFYLIFMPVNVLILYKIVKKWCYKRNQVYVEDKGMQTKEDTITTKDKKVIKHRKLQ